MYSESAIRSSMAIPSARKRSPICGQSAASIIRPICRGFEAVTGEWQPISEERIWDNINKDWSNMGFDQRRLWEAVKIMPERWSNQQKHYDHGSWVIAIIGSWVVWYDDIEEGFTR